MDIRMTFDKLDRRVRSRAKENLEAVTYARSREKNYIYILIILVVADLVHFVIGRMFKNHIGFIAMMIVIWFGIYFVFSRVSGFGLSDKSFIYIKYSNLLFREKKIEDILVDKVQYLDVKNRMFSTKVDLRYIDETGKANEINFSIPKFIVDKNKKRFKMDRENICNKLLELQKVLDKGDF